MVTFHLDPGVGSSLRLRHECYYSLSWNYPYTAANVYLLDLARPMFSSLLSLLLLFLLYLFSSPTLLLR